MLAIQDSVDTVDELTQGAKYDPLDILISNSGFLREPALGTTLSTTPLRWVLLVGKPSNSNDKM